jgi:glycine betaine transporter
MGSSCTGLDQGIRLLSNLNVGVAVFLLLFVFFAGPTVFCLRLFVDSLGIYIQNLPEQSLRLNPFVESYETWMEDWTLNYFTWWIAWSPFVGIFIARISRGRTLRQLITGCLLVPAGFSVFWFAVFGGTAIYLQRIEGIDIGPKMLGDVSLSTFLLLDQLPLSGLTSFVTIVLLFTFLVTSADSATFVISMMTSRGNLDPPLRLKVFWGVVLAALTLVLVVGGGVDALQAATLVFAFPLVLMAFSLRFRLSIQVKERRI